MEIADVLAEHEQSARNQRCSCGWRPDASKSVIDPDNVYAQHQAHVAEALAVVVQEKQAEAWDEGSHAGWSDRTHSFMERRTYEQEVALATPNPYRAKA